MGEGGGPRLEDPVLGSHHVAGHSQAGGAGLQSSEGVRQRHRGEQRQRDMEIGDKEETQRGGDEASCPRFLGNSFPYARLSAYATQGECRFFSTKDTSIKP